MHDFAAFCRLVHANLQLDGPLADSREVGLFDDLALDSLQTFQLVILIEESAGLMVPPEFPPEMYTIGQAFDYYLQAARLAASQ